MKKANLNSPEIVRKERRGFAVLLAGWKAAAGVKSGLLLVLGLPVGGAFYAGHLAGKAEVSQLRQESAAETGWRFARSREEETGSLFSQASAEGKIFPSRNSLDIVAKANEGKLADLEKAIAGAAVKGADIKEAAAQAEAAAAEKDASAPENILSGLEASVGAAKKGGDAGASGIGRMRDSLNSSSGFGMSGGVMRGFEKPQLSNQVLAKQEALNQALGKARAFSRDTQARVKSAARSRVAPTAVINGQNAQRLARMNSAMAPTKAGGDGEGDSAIHSREWASAEGSGSTVGGGASRIVGDGADSSYSGSGLGSPVNQRSSQQSGELAPLPRVKGEDKTPDQSLIMMGQMLITVATLGVMLAGMFKANADSAANESKAAWLTAAFVTAGLAGLSAVGALGVGVALIAKGNALQGGIFVVLGALLAIIAAVVMVKSYEGSNIENLVQGEAAANGGAGNPAGAADNVPSADPAAPGDSAFDGETPSADPSNPGDGAFDGEELPLPEDLGPGESEMLLDEPLPADELPSLDDLGEALGGDAAGPAAEAPGSSTADMDEELMQSLDDPRTSI